ncbi:DNase I-like protein [Guyanagaster necrorhizus]|uniref:DNase I-like protein n=1 Tax=Guyanagaster necrorhizus TaxID=856835 RepID=A0A9P8AW62_9AGAR|nr:DNase I-like protein [Guyanagaster necrorhizus MCA 3950]KAG7449826.1 DNase I-like protein [Guyanagaster necrorhizus MCA 3950]
MTDLATSLRLLLRSSDDVKFTLQVSALTPSITERDDDTTTLQSRRILAVILHKDELNALEEGGVFVLKHHPSRHDAPDTLDIQRVFPIYDGFSMTMAQLRRETTDLRASFSASRPQSGFKLTIKSHEESLSFITYDVQGLTAMLAECRRLKKIVDSLESSSAPQTYSWLAPYTSEHSSLPIFSLSPLDVRLSTRPLHARLSSASAGLPGDDIDDILMIRDDWVRKTARHQVRKGRRRLNIRLGTFNVNGKMPSQDLSSWIQENDTNAHDLSIIPPLTDISPLSVGEVKRNPLDNAVDIRSSISAPPTPSTLVPSSTVSSLSYSSASSTRVIQSPPPFPSTTSSAMIEPASSASAFTAYTYTQPSELSYSPSDIGQELEADPIPLDPDPYTQNQPDVFVLGFQELDLSTEALIYSTGTAREDAWCMAIFAALGEWGEHYVKLASKQLVGMLIVIIVKDGLKDCFRDVRTSAAGAGIMGVMGNKGGTAIRLAFIPPPTEGILTQGPTILTFVNSHLAAFDVMVDRRNADYADLGKRLVFGGSDVDDTTTMWESDAVFWMGDLNYRIDLSDLDLRAILSEKCWEGNRFEILLPYDQLKTSVHSQKAFDVFTEFPIMHRPTYRFSQGILTDSMGYDVNRKPAWTDRILHVFSPTHIRVKQTRYGGHHKITMSDHKPLSADFIVDVDVYDKNHKLAVAKTLYRQLEDIGSYANLKVKVEPSGVSLGRLSYKRKRTHTFQVKNLGKVPCTFRFVPIEPNAELYPSWVHIEPITGLIMPMSNVEITVTVHVDEVSAVPLNEAYLTRTSNRQQIDCTLILRTLGSGGKDSFVVISGEWEPTCFAVSLDTLTRLSGPISQPQSRLLGEDERVNAPREVMRLVEWLMACPRESLQTELFSSHPSGAVTDMRKCLDTGSQFPSTVPPSLAGATLVALLSALPESVMPRNVNILNIADREAAFEILETLPTANVNVWISVTAFLHYIAREDGVKDADAGEEPKQNEKAARISAMFAPVLLRDISEASPVKKWEFLMYFIA